MQQQKLCLKWNNHTINLLSVLGTFQQQDILVDVTLSCEGRNIKAHKMVLSACSPYFQSIFLENPCQHPIVIINGMKYEDITAILNFMYKGEVNVSHEGLSSFLQAAEALKVKGLAEVCGEKKSTNSDSHDVEQDEPMRPQRTDTPNKKRHKNRKRTISDSNRSDDEGTSRKHNSPEVHELSGDESYTGDMSSNGPPLNSLPRVPQNVFSRSHQSSSNLGGEEEADEYEVEPSKLLEQTLTTDSVSMSNSGSSDHSLRIERIMGNATEMESSSMQEPESPPDIKPIIEYSDSDAGPSEGIGRIFNDQSQPGPSNFQDSSHMHDSSQAQEYSSYREPSPSMGGVPMEIFSFMKNRPDLSIFGTSTKAPSVQFRCEICPYETNIQQHYQTHLMEHKSTKDYPCQICGKLYKSEYRLQIHLASHDSNCPHVCVYCEKKFKTQSMLNNHLKTHFPTADIVCGICNKQFSSKTVLKRHMAHVHSVENYQK